jgi:hypothetical protein
MSLQSVNLFGQPANLPTQPMEEVIIKTKAKKPEKKDSLR